MKAVTNRKKITRKLCGFAVALTLAIGLWTGRIDASAQEYSYPTAEVNIDLADDVLIITKDTKDYDSVWEKAGITDIKGTMDKFDDMNIIAIFHDPDTKTTVNLITNKTQESVNLFSLQDKTDEEIVEKVKSMMPEADGISVDVSLLDRSLNSLPYFKLDMVSTATGFTVYEVVYGTFFNARMVQLDCYNENGEPVDETFMTEVLRGITYPNIMTLEEYNEAVAKSMRSFILFFVVILIGFVLLLFTGVFSKKRTQTKAQMVSDALSDFRERRRAGKVDLTTPPVITAEATYTDKTLDDFQLFLAWLKNWPVLYPSAVFFLIITYLMFSSDAIIYAILTLVLGVGLLYYNYSRTEKIKESLKKRYDIKNRPHFDFAFHDEFFTVRTPGTNNEYIYKQVTSVRTFREYIYLFTGDTQAIILTKDEVNGDIRELIKMVKAK